MIAAVAITILSALFVTSASTVPSSSFIIKRGAALGSFDVTGAQRNIRLTTGLTYEITCKAGGVPGSVDQRWYRDGSAVEKREDSSTCSSLTEVFYKDDVDNSNQWFLTFCNFDTTLAGSFTCRPTLNYNKTLIVTEGTAHTAVVALCTVYSSVVAGNPRVALWFLHHYHMVTNTISAAREERLQQTDRQRNTGTPSRATSW